MKKVVFNKSFRRVSITYALYSFLIAALFERGISVVFFTQVRHFSTFHIAMFQTALFLSDVFTEIPTGAFADRFGRRLSIWLGCALVAISCLGQIYLTSFVTVMLTFMARGVGFSFLSGSATGLIYDLLLESQNEKRYLKLSAFIKLLCAVSSFSSMAIGGWVQQFSWNFPFLLTAAASFMGGACFLLVRERPSRSQKQREKRPRGGLSLWKTLRQLNRPLLMSLIPLTMIHSLITPYFIFLQTLLSKSHVSVLGIATILGAAEIVGNVFVVSFDKTILKARLKTIALISLSGSGVALLLNFSANIQVSVLGYFIMSVFSMLVAGHTENTFQAFVQEPSQRASILSLLTLADSLSVAFGLLATGYLAEYFSIYWILGACGGLPLLGWAAIYWTALPYELDISLAPEDEPDDADKVRPLPVYRRAKVGPRSS